MRIWDSLAHWEHRLLIRSSITYVWDRANLRIMQMIFTETLVRPDQVLHPDHWYFDVLNHRFSFTQSPPLWRFLVRCLKSPVFRFIQLHCNLVRHLSLKLDAIVKTVSHPVAHYCFRLQFATAIVVKYESHASPHALWSHIVYQECSRGFFEVFLVSRLYREDTAFAELWCIG